MPTFTCYPFLHQNKPSRESIFCGKVGNWWTKRVLIMLNFLLKTIQKAIKPYLHAWQRNGKHVLVLPLQAFCSATTSLLFCRYKPFFLPLQTVCSATISCLFCHYKPFVLPLQASCTVATSHLYRHYNVLVVGLQTACSALLCQKAHCKGYRLCGRS